jgi:hypothetical protein
VIARILLPVAVAMVVPVSAFPVVAGFVAGVLATLLLLTHIAPPPAAETVEARTGFDRSVGAAEHWLAPGPSPEALDVLLYGPPGDVFIQGQGRAPVAPVSGEWQSALDRSRRTDLPAHARSVAAQRRWDAPSPATQPTEAVA